MKPHRYVPLVEVHPARDRKIAYADARAGRVPAFQLCEHGRWYVDLDQWEAFIESKTTAPQGTPRPAA